MKYPSEGEDLYKILRYSLKSGQPPVLFLCHFLISLTCSDGTKYHHGRVENRGNYIINDLPIKIGQASLYLEAIKLGNSGSMEEYKAFLLKCEDENRQMRRVNSSFRGFFVDLRVHYSSWTFAETGAQPCITVVGMYL